MEQERFRQLLRWYPRSWRESNGDVLLATMLDDAERADRTVPSVGERWSALGHGLGTRLDAVVALRAGLAALGVAAVAGVVLVWASQPLSAADNGWLLQALLAACSWLIAVGAVALARERGLVTEPRAVVLVILSLIALTLNATTQAGWGLAFDAADEGTAATGLGSAWPGLLAAAGVAGVAALGLFVEALLRRSSLHAVARVTLAVLCGMLLAPLIGLTLVSPYPAAVGAATVALVALIPVRGARRAPIPAVPDAASAHPGEVSVETRRVARVFALISATGSAFGVVFALTGSLWAGAADATVAMGQGIIISLAAGLPLLAAIGMMVAAGARSRVVHTWGPLLLAASGLTAVAVAYLSAPAWESMAPALAVGSALGGAALSWWISPRLRGPASTRISISVLIGLAYAAFVGLLVAPMLAFVLPLAAVAFALATTRRRRVPPASSAVGAQPAPAAGRA